MSRYVVVAGRREEQLNCINKHCENYIQNINPKTARIQSNQQKPAAEAKDEQEQNQQQKTVTAKKTMTE